MTSSSRTPFGQRLAGDAVGAARAWSALGCDYERAAVLSDGDDESQLEALLVWRGLGAAPAATRLAARRRDAGLTVPRGPRTASAQNIGGLTARELEILVEVAAGRTNAQIAGALHVSAKTVEHHVSHVLGKLGARSRADAVAIALSNGLTVTRSGPGGTPR